MYYTPNTAFWMSTVVTPGIVKVEERTVRIQRQTVLPMSSRLALARERKLLKQNKHANKQTKGKCLLIIFIASQEDERHLVSCDPL